jgi:predicted ribosome quality control (RQC) complex YloA/Tae2 family protein
MKTENVFIQGVKREILFHIGKNKDENFEVIDNGKLNDIWFHAKDISSCHVVCELPEDIDKRDLRYIVKVGALLCKNNTNKLKSQKKVEIIYTEIQNVTKTIIPGCVSTQNTKMIIC